MDTLIIVFSTVLIAITLGIISELINSSKDKEKFKAPGKFININGHNMHIFTTGTSKNKIVLISGLNTPSPFANFEPLWDRLSVNNTVILLERFGYGFSDFAKNDRTFQKIVEEMNIALTLSGQKTPYTLVGHSLGGPICMAYAQQYPDQVQNIVMLDSAVPTAFVSWKRPVNLIKYIAPLLRHVGLLRLFTLSHGFLNILRYNANGYKKMPDDLLPVDRSLIIRNGFNPDVISESDLLHFNMNYIMEKNYPYNIPTLFISTPYIYNLIPDSKNDEADYLTNAPNSKLVHLDGSHYIHQYDPDKVTNLINEFILTSNSQKSI